MNRVIVFNTSVDAENENLENVIVEGHLLQFVSLTESIIDTNDEKNIDSSIYAVIKRQDGLVAHYPSNLIRVYPPRVYVSSHSFLTKKEYTKFEFDIAHGAILLHDYTNTPDHLTSDIPFRDFKPVVKKAIFKD